MPVLRLRPPLGELEATFVPAHGLLATSLRHRGAELLGERGIPLLHPWANRLATELPDSPLIPRDEHGLPIHGLLAPYWDVFAATSSMLGAELDFGAHPELLEFFPYPHRVVMRAGVGARTLTVRTTLVAGDEAPVPVSFGFHPYLRLPHVLRSTLALDDLSIPTGASEFAPAESFVRGARTYDDGYASLRRGARFALSGGGRRIVLRLDAGYPCAQVYAPADDDVICFEPMTAPTNALVSGDRLTWVAPGSSYTATYSISVA
ncbi:MAG: aldose 1-epimerase [Actinobacteria bacterium]|nr:MAG: aldose 1-epimerase [Actinomycetota bacterium]